MNDLDDKHSGVGAAASDVAMARRDLPKGLPKRFYRQAAAAQLDGLHVVTLDGKPALTPGRARLALPTLSAAQAVAAEWENQIAVVDPAQMPLTRLLNSALDAVAQEVEAVRADVVKYAGSDLLCYRAGEPESLIEAQNHAWDPIIAWAREEIGADLALTQGVVFVEQPLEAIAAVREAVARIPAPIPLAALHVMTTLTGSALLALAVARGRLSAPTAWRAAHVDEDFEILTWGVDAEAMARRERRWREMEAASLLARLG
jgi:chaperone required for assembly of F1-ATPase